MRKYSEYKKEVICALLIALITFVFSLQCSPNLWCNAEAGTDSSVFRTVAMMMDRGYVPYRDTFDHKGPFIYILNWLGMQISYYRGIWLIEFAALFGTFLYMYKIIRTFCGRKLSVVLLIVCVALLFSYFDGGNLTEEYAMPFISMALFYYTKYLLTSEIYPFQIGLCGFGLGAVCLLRPNMIAVWGVFSFAVLIKCLSEKKYGDIAKYLFYFISGVCVICIPILVWLWVKGALYQLLYDYILFNLQYSEAGAEADGAQFNSFIFFLNNKWILFSLMILVYLIVRKKFLVPVSYAICFGVTLYMISLSGAQHMHYGMVIVPLLAYPLANLGKWCEKAMRKPEGAIASFVIMYLIVVLAFPAWLGGIERLEQCLSSRGKSQRNAITTNTVDYIVKSTDEDDKITVWGNWNIIYVLSQRIPASRYSYQHPIGTVDSGIYEQYFAEIEEQNPTLIVIREDGTEQMIVDFVKEHDYKEVFRDGADPVVKIYRKA